jgi:hypothetical protein
MKETATILLSDTSSLKIMAEQEIQAPQGGDQDAEQEVTNFQCDLP